MRNSEVEYWDYVALEAKNYEKLMRLEKWKRVARNWLAHYADKRTKDFVLNVVDKLVKLDDSAKVLDVGCGPGKWLKILAERSGLVTAIDISPKMVFLAEERAMMERLTNVTFYVMDVSRLGFPDKTYDFVNCITVLQHVFDDNHWKRAIHEIVRVTKPNGYILLFETAPNFTIKKRTPHVAIRTMRRYEKEFRDAGASLVYWRSVDLSLPVTFFGLRGYAASFNKKVYFFFSEKNPLWTAAFLSFLSQAACFLARFIDYKLAETPLGFLSFGRILLFRKLKE